MYSRSYPSYSTNNSNSSSTCISSSSPYPNSFLPSGPVRSRFLHPRHHHLRVDLTSSSHLPSHPFCRFPRDVHRTACLRSPRHDGKGSVRRLQAESARPRGQLCALPRPRLAPLTCLGRRRAIALPAGRQSPADALRPFLLHTRGGPRPAREEPATSGGPHPPPHIRLLRDVLYPHRPA